MGARVARQCLVPPAAPFVAAPPPLQAVAGLQRLVLPRTLAPFTWTSVGADGREIGRTIADHAGHGVVLNIWATWCDPCAREMPSLARLAASVAQAPIDILPVSIDRSGAAAVRAFYKAHAIEGLPVLIDRTSSAMASLDVGGIPTTFLLGPDGMLRARFDGAADWDTADAIASVRRLTA